MLLRDNQFQAIFLLPKVKIIQKKTHFKSHRFNQSATNIDRQSVCENLLAGLLNWRENFYIITDDNLITIYLNLSQFYHDKSTTKTELLQALGEFYTPEKQARFGVLGILIELI